MLGHPSLQLRWYFLDLDFKLRSPTTPHRLLQRDDLYGELALKIPFAPHFQELQLGQNRSSQHRLNQNARWVVLHTSTAAWLQHYPRQKIILNWGRGSVEPLDASPEWGPRRGPQLPNSLEQDLSCLTCWWHVAFNHLLPLPDIGSPEARREMLHLVHTESWSCGWSWPQHRLTFHGFMSPSLPLLSDDD